MGAFYVYDKIVRSSMEQFGLVIFTKEKFIIYEIFIMWFVDYF